MSTAEPLPRVFDDSHHAATLLRKFWRLTIREYFGGSELRPQPLATTSAYLRAPGRQP
jgi:hypothetical protein